MKKILLTVVAIAVLSATSLVTEAEAGSRRRAQRQAAQQSWHAPYYHTAWKQPVALVVPPTARNRTEYNWGVGGTTSTPIHHQFSPVMPLHGGNGQQLRPTPAIPYSTSQFGIYYIRAPW